MRDTRNSRNRTARRARGDNWAFVILYSIIGALLFWTITTSSGLYDQYRSTVPFWPLPNPNPFILLFAYLFFISFMTSIIGRGVAYVIIKLYSRKVLNRAATKKLFEFNWKLTMIFLLSSLLMSLILTIGLDIVLLNLFNIQDTQIFSVLVMYILLKGFTYIIAYIIIKIYA
jgi:hypothetical protein